MYKKRPKRDSQKNCSETAEESYTSNFSCKNDPFRSYTGYSKEDEEKPEQDADDL